MGGYLVPTYVFYLRRYLFPNRLRMIAGTDPGTSTQPELPGSVPDFFAGSNVYFLSFMFFFVYATPQSVTAENCFEEVRTIFWYDFVAGAQLVPKNRPNNRKRGKKQARFHARYIGSAAAASSLAARRLCQA